jgi:hypothetical protein
VYNGTYYGLEKTIFLGRLSLCLVKEKKKKNVLFKSKLKPVVLSY